MSKIFRGGSKLLKWGLVFALCIEITSFVIVTTSNFLLYGHAREGSRAQYDPYTLFLQSHGVRPTLGNSQADNPQLNRIIWCLGGSTMRGATDSDAQTIPSHLARMLNSEGEELHYTVVNYGVNSFNSLLETKYLQKLLIEEAVLPHVVVFYDGANDAKYFAENRSVYGHHGYRKIKGLVESYYRSWFGLLKPLNAAWYASFTVELYDKFHQVLLPIEPDDPELRRMVDLTERRYDHVYRILQAYGAEFVLCWQPMWWTEACPISEKVKVCESGPLLTEHGKNIVGKNFAVPYYALRERLKDKPYFEDLSNELCERTTVAYQKDGVHLTDSGREMVANRIKNILKKRLLHDITAPAATKKLFSSN